MRTNMLYKLILLFFLVQWTHSTTIDLGGIISGNRMAAVPLGRTISNGILDVEGICMKSGMACQNCTHSVTCVMLPGGWLKVPLQECKNDKTCNAHLGTCTCDHVPECEAATLKYQHICEQVGIFPDAYDCRKFHLCSPPEGLPDERPAVHRAAMCPRHYGYNPQTAQCSIKLANGQCDKKPVPKCTEVGQTDALETSPNHYYVCLIKDTLLYPQIFICPNGWFFWDGFCHEEPKPEYENTTLPKELLIPVTENTTHSPHTVTSTSVKQEITTTRMSKDRKTVGNIESFFSTEKVTTPAADMFLADKFDLSNYETLDDAQPSNDAISNSFESSEFF